MAQFTQEFKKNALAMLGTLTPTQIVEKLGISKTAFYRWKQQAEHPGKSKRKPGKKGKGASSKRKQYTDDVKQRAVALVREGKLTQTEIAKSVGCSLFTLRVWCKEQGKKKDYTKPTIAPRPYLAVGVRYKNLPPLFVSWVADHTLAGRRTYFMGSRNCLTRSVFSKPQARNILIPAVEWRVSEPQPEIAKSCSEGLLAGYSYAPQYETRFIPTRHFEYTPVSVAPYIVSHDYNFFRTVVTELVSEKLSTALHRYLEEDIRIGISKDITANFSEEMLTPERQIMVNDVVPHTLTYQYGILETTYINAVNQLS